MNRDPIAWYDAHGDEVAGPYESLRAADVNRWLIDCLPTQPATVLDIGAGTGRDAAWLASLGHDVVAVEPSAALRDAGRRCHGDRPIQWINDRLPGLETITRHGMAFDVILLNAVWMHVREGDRHRAFRKLINLLRPGGLVAMTLRMGPPDPERGFHPVSVHELETLARGHGAYLVRQDRSDDLLGRRDVTWRQVAIQLPDDGSGALPLLRHIILNDSKSSTYKLALLRTLCRIADGAAGMAIEADEESVSVPLGLVGLIWLRLFKPLLAADLPQNPTHIGLQNLGFVKEAYQRLDTLVSAHDLRIGMRFGGDRAASLHRALGDAVGTIATMPARFTTYPNGSPVFPVRRERGSQRMPDPVSLDHPYLLGFGEMWIPHHLWATLRRFDAWIEPAIIAEWSGLIQAYARRQDRSVDPATIHRCMTWDDPSRDVGIARGRARTLLQTERLYCTWSGRRLTSRSLAIDHCLPWSIWPCGDLWNLMPSQRSVNSKKSARLPADDVLCEARDRVLDWWKTAYDGAMTDRFWLEAQASLPSARPGERNPDDIFDALRFQRRRLKFDQQVPEWQGP